ncbi:MAG: methyltransferase domain-containing protein [Anaerolineae bacterium]
MKRDPNSVEFWDESYLQGLTGWDLCEPTPVFARLIGDGRITPGRMIVLGAGKGHDARLFARAGFAVTAVDFAEEAVKAMRELAEPEAPVAVLQADIFDLPGEMDGRFDLLLEYTCFCAIDPTRRTEYADVVTQLLKPGGLYIALAFPISRHVGGPPFAVQPDGLIFLLTMRGFTLKHREIPADSVASRQGREELLILQKS